MISANKGHVVTVASLAGLSGVNKLADYCASKFAAVGFDESLRLELLVRRGKKGSRERELGWEVGGRVGRGGGGYDKDKDARVEIMEGRVE